MLNKKDLSQNISLMPMRLRLRYAQAIQIKTAYSQGQRLLKNEAVHSALKEGQKAIENKLLISTAWACEKYRGLIDASQKAEQYHITLNILNSLVDRLKTFENEEESLKPILFEQQPNKLPLRKIIHPGYEIRE